MSMNIITIMGRLTKDPEVRMTQSQKSVASFTMAVDRDYVQAGEDRETDFIDVVAFGKTADFVSRYFTKGSMAIASGRLQLRDWTDRDGNKRRQAEVICDRVWFGENKKTDATQAKPEKSRLKPVEEEDGQLPF